MATHTALAFFGPAIIVEMQRACPACGEQFACGAALRDCWCAEMELSEAARAALRERYTGCLCRACLQRHAAGTAPGVNP
ncbi:MAG: cysteine-rich CWC family protein [Candidatus Acidiferrales bacterium]